MNKNHRILSLAEQQSCKVNAQLIGTVIVIKTETINRRHFLIFEVLNLQIVPYNAL